MQFKQLTALALAGAVSGQSLTDLIGQNQDLSQLGTLLGQYPDLAQQLGGLSNITVLAPNNAALSALLNDSSVTAAVAADPGLVPASKCRVPIDPRRRNPGGTPPRGTLSSRSPFHFYSLHHGKRNSLLIKH